MEWELACGKRGKFLSIWLNADDFVAKFCHGNSVSCTQISKTNNSYLHEA
jgi:hypothetical protein